MRRPFSCAVFVSLALAAAAGDGAACTNSGSFERWLSEFRAEARAKGISPRALSALDGVTFDQGVINSDRGQKVFSQTFLDFSDRMAAKYRIERGRQLIKKYKAIFDQIDQRFGVPAPVIVGYWALETDFGANVGNLPTLRSLATLAYDCRRPDRFREELLDALRIVERGDLRPEEMHGPWAGEMGQTQFVPSIYYKYGIDGDGDGRADLIHSVPDALVSSANYLHGLGWRRDEPWLQEVRVPESMDWSQADLNIQHTVNEWARMGVRLADAGAAFPAICGRRCSCRWGGMARLSSPSIISKSIWSGTSRSSIRPRLRIWRRASTARPPCREAAGSRRSAMSRRRSCRACLRRAATMSARLTASLGWRHARASRRSRKSWACLRIPIQALSLSRACGLR